MWISHSYTYIPFLLNPTPHLSPHPMPLDCRRALGWAPCVIQQIPTGYLFYIWSCICQRYALNSSLLQRISVVLNWMNGQGVWELWIGFLDHHSEYSSVIGSFNFNSRVQLFTTPWTAALQAPLPGDSPGKNTGVGCHALLQGIVPTQGSNPGLLADSLPTEPPGTYIHLKCPLPKLAC